MPGVRMEARERKKAVGLAQLCRCVPVGRGEVCKGQFRGALSSACKQGRDFSFYCHLSRERKATFRSPFSSHSSTGRHSDVVRTCWPLPPCLFTPAPSPQTMLPAFQAGRGKTLHLVKFEQILCFSASFGSHCGALQRWFC